MENLGILDDKNSELIDRPDYEYIDPNNRLARTHLRMLRRGDVALVLLSELPDNPGMSITNAAEKVATAVAKGYKLNGPNCLWVEHYPASRGMASPETFAVITFEWSKDIARNAQWEELSSGDGQLLLNRLLFKGRVI